MHTTQHGHGQHPFLSTPSSPTSLFCPNSVITPLLPSPQRLSSAELNPAPSIFSLLTTDNSRRPPASLMRVSSLSPSLDQPLGTLTTSAPAAIAHALAAEPSETQPPRDDHDSTNDFARPSPLSIPEILQEVCCYLDRPALVHASQVSKQFWACTAPLLWTSIPEHAWENDYFVANWHRYGSRIVTLQCGPGVDLGRVSMYCHNLLSLDVSRVREPVGENRHDEELVIDKNNAGTRNSNNNVMIIDKYGHDRRDSRISATRKKPKHDLSGDSYTSFLRMTDDLVRVIHNNKNLRCLQMKPQGRFPPHLLEALSQLEHLEVLSLNAWHDFQEYSLQLIMEDCPGLSHLSLGENDFTRFTLDSLLDSETALPSIPNPKLPCPGNLETSVKLEQYDDPIKSRNGSYHANHDSLEIHSKRAVLYTPSSASHNQLPSLAPQHQQHSLEQVKGHRPSTAHRNQIRKLSLHQTGLRQEFLVNLTSQCPHLEHLSLLNGWGFYPSTRFASILSQSCPNLSRLEFREQALDLQDEFFASLCEQLPRLQWIHAGMTGFSTGAMEAVRMHCKDIVSLNLDGARGIQSQALDQILRSCDSLKVLSAQGVVLNGRDLSSNGSSRWVCRGLETLVLDIEIYAAVGGSATQSESVKIIRERVYDQLADLSRLQTLGLGGGHCVGGTEPGVDLTLASGLEKLTSLHCLERLDLRRMVRTQVEEDLEWMVQHWPKWCFLEASNKSRLFNRGNDKTHKAIEWLHRARPGMDISFY
ncbi:hypothetical protein BGZ58_005398 [Dissophora ornata]|nr:hypothetical protein BGZ58_005398 [Dissophora ornata]